jgi:hypothetical protein
LVTCGAMRRIAAQGAMFALLGWGGLAASAVDAGVEPTDAAADAGGCEDGAAPACPTYVRYVNEKFAFSVDVPAFFAKRGADADGRGQPFEYGKRAKARAWAMYNAPVMTVEQLYADWARRDNVTFKTLAANTWVVRGSERGRLYYSRSILADGIITTIEVSYDPALADTFEPILARMGASLMALPGQGVRGKTGRPAPP